MGLNVTPEFSDDALQNFNINLCDDLVDFSSYLSCNPNDKNLRGLDLMNSDQMNSDFTEISFSGNQSFNNSRFYHNCAKCLMVPSRFHLR